MNKLDYILNTPVINIDEIIANKKPKGKRNGLANRIICVDGTEISVQASSGHYCSPRDDYGPWYKVECGYPSVAPPDTWEEYAEEWDTPTNTVYGWIPVELVREFIEKHGGEKNEPL